jgi:hypothetical protein
MEARITALLACFAQSRRISDDVYWLRENAELLNILESTGQSVPQEALLVHAGYYENAEKRLQFFPQYYRFLLSIALDLEDLGMPGNIAERMVDFACKQGLVEAELSDLQRAEARRLLTRRGVNPVRDPGLDDRLRAFANRSATFALPNKKAAYELTHIVFYLSEYGRKDPGLEPEAIESLHYTGLTAFLDQNADLVAEGCISLRYAGQEPPALWTDWLYQQTASYAVDAGPGMPINDDYHEFFVCNWHQAVTGAPMFRKPLSPERMRFDRAARPNALREISQTMLVMDDQRSGDWNRMRPRMEAELSDQARDVLHVAAQSSDRFNAYFQGFARAGAVGNPPLS